MKDLTGKSIFSGRFKSLLMSTWLLMLSGSIKKVDLVILFSSLEDEDDDEEEEELLCEAAIKLTYTY